MFKSIVGMSYSCPNQIPGYFYVFKNANGITYPDSEMTMDAKVAIKAIVYPHPSPQDTSIIMLQGRPGMLSNALLVSEKDIETIKEFQTTGYILNNNNVYQFNTGSYTNMIKLTNMADSIKYFCPQIDHF